MSATNDEIERRIEDHDTPRTAQRSAAAKRVAELARCRGEVAAQLDAIERDLGEILAESAEIIEIRELARFTDVSVANLSQWLDKRKNARAKRKKPTSNTSRGKNMSSQSKPSSAVPVSRKGSTVTEPEVTELARNLAEVR
ncbi:hypothetical protein [Amycolatopsis jejuensis]|uniref:hypothetical protein n=1 Tax=Amycolatopsis jejuensis TaxID=330084 RepID=UPI00068B0096|nr:hypothetical protein [Amycolatopsis jejuensis]